MAVANAARFAGRVADYVRFRPRYPAAAATIAREGRPEGGRVADVGAGTGLYSVQLMRDGFDVVGVEPNAEMRAASTALLGGGLEKYFDPDEYPPAQGTGARTPAAARTTFEVVNGTGDATTLPGGSVDVVTVAQTFHWLGEPAAVRKEFSRILRAAPGTTEDRDTSKTPPVPNVFVLWNDRRETGSAPMEELEAVIAKHGTDYATVKASQFSAEQRAFENFFDASYGTRTVPNLQALTLEGLVGRVASASYVPPRSDPRFAAMERDLVDLFERHRDPTDNRFRLEYDTHIYYGYLRPGPR